MAAKPLTTEAIVLTEKKMDMTLDDVIKMSKNTNTRKPKKVPGVLAKRRSNFRGNQFPVAAEVAQKAAVAPLHYKVSNHI